MGKKSTVRYVNHCLNLLSDDGVEGNRKLWRFQENDINLVFLEQNLVVYQQLSCKFEQALSIIDVMMHNHKDEIKKMLNDYSLK